MTGGVGGKLDDIVVALGFRQTGSKAWPSLKIDLNSEESVVDVLSPRDYSSKIKMGLCGRTLLSAQTLDFPEPAHPHWL